MYSGNKISYIELTVDNWLCFGIILQVLDIDSDKSWIQIIWSLDNIKFRDKNYIIEYMDFFKIFFNYIRSNKEISTIHNI